MVGPWRCCGLGSCFGSVDLVHGLGLSPCRSMVVVGLLIGGFFFPIFEMVLVINGSGLMVLVWFC